MSKYGNMILSNEIKFVNIENWELLTEKQLFDFYNDVVIKEESHYEETAEDFYYYLNCCMTENNGSLELVTKLSTFDVLKMIERGEITAETANAMLNTILNDNADFYKTNDNSFYTTNGMYFYSLEDLETITE